MNAPIIMGVIIVNILGYICFEVLLIYVKL